MYHYIGCGLPHVYLENGFEIVKTPFGRGVTIHDLDGLHDALHRVVANSPEPGQPGSAAVLGCHWHGTSWRVSAMSKPPAARWISTEQAAMGK
jgi:hypothetical protein